MTVRSVAGSFNAGKVYLCALYRTLAVRPVHSSGRVAGRSLGMMDPTHYRSTAPAWNGRCLVSPRPDESALSRSAQALDSLGARVCTGQHQAAPLKYPVLTFLGQLLKFLVPQPRSPWLVATKRLVVSRTRALRLVTQRLACEEAYIRGALQDRCTKRPIATRRTGNSSRRAQRHLAPAPAPPVHTLYRTAQTSVQELGHFLSIPRLHQNPASQHRLD